jgi:hypothetical protein
MEKVAVGKTAKSNIAIVWEVVNCKTGKVVDRNIQSPSRMKVDPESGCLVSLTSKFKVEDL